MADAYTAPAPMTQSGWSTGPSLQTAARVQSDGPVKVELNGLGDDVSKLEAIVAHLEDRIETCLTPSEPCPPTVGIDDLPPDACDVARRIHEIRQSVRRIQERGNELTNRVQL